MLISQNQSRAHFSQRQLLTIFAILEIRAGIPADIFGAVFDVLKKKCLTTWFIHSIQMNTCLSAYVQPKTRETSENPVTHPLHHL